jgi:integrase
LLVQPNGKKWWRFRYKWNGREQMLSMGVYPDVSLLQARERRNDARRLLARKIDPGAERRAVRAVERQTFEGVARHYLAGLARQVRDNQRSAETLKKATWMLERFVFPDLGPRPIGEITSKELLVTLKKIETQNFRETARRTKQKCGQIFRHAVGLGYAERDITVDLRGLLESPLVEHHASITEPAQVGALLRALDNYHGRPETRAALRLAPLVFVRPGELRTAEWEHVDILAAQWRIPAHLMKMRRPHIVPLSHQAIEILHELKQKTGDGRFLFPMQLNRERPMSEFTVNYALRALGYSSGQFTGHGFRSMATTLLNEHGWDTEAIERQLGHVEGNGVKAAYNYAQHLPLRERMMQWWADYLYKLRALPAPASIKEEHREFPSANSEYSAECASIRPVGDDSQPSDPVPSFTIIDET